MPDPRPVPRSDRVPSRRPDAGPDPGRDAPAGPRRRLDPAEKVLRSFIRDGRLVSIPAKPAKRNLLLPWLLDTCFPEDRDYEEKEVNQRLALWHRDAAALRRYLVDAGLMTRAAGIYRRTRPMATPAADVGDEGDLAGQGSVDSG